MYRILIVDDEFLVRLGLKTTIDWKEHGYQVVGEASNGQEALKMMDTLKPDIVLVDIKMPLMDGLEFISHAGKLTKHVSFIILTNYENFQYAKQAMRLGVSQYLLKSEINPETLLDALESACQGHVDKAKQGQNGEEERMRYLSRSLSKGQINRSIAPERLEAPVEGLFPEEQYIVVKYYCNIGTMTEQSINMLSKTMISLLETEYPGLTYCENLFQMHYYMTIIFPCADEKEIYKKAIDKSQLIARKIKYYFDTIVRGGISEKKEAEQIPVLLNQSESARRRCFFDTESFMVFDGCFQGYLKTMERVQVSGTKLSKILSTGNFEELCSYIYEIFQVLRTQMNYSNVKHAFLDFLSSAKLYLETIDEETGKNLIKRFDYDIWDTLTSIDEAESYLCDAFESLLQRIGENGSYSISIRKSIAFIEENYEKNITLQDVADHVGISKNYLSMLFKQETEINFVTYLNRYRIEKAKQLLTTTNMKIYEIADSVGFYSPYYFSKVFKEQTRMQCKEYREKFSVIEQGGPE